MAIEAKSKSMSLSILLNTADAGNFQEATFYQSLLSLFLILSFLLILRSGKEECNLR